MYLQCLTHKGTDQMLCPRATHHPDLYDFISLPEGIRPHLCFRRNTLQDSSFASFPFFPTMLLSHSSAHLNCYWASAVKNYATSTSSKRPGMWTPLALRELCSLDQFGLMSWAIYCLVRFQKQLKTVSLLSSVISSY